MIVALKFHGALLFAALEVEAPPVDIADSVELVRVFSDAHASVAADRTARIKLRYMVVSWLKAFVGTVLVARGREHLHEHAGDGVSRGLAGGAPVAPPQ
jgi:hypothetical protein